MINHVMGRSKENLFSACLAITTTKAGTSWERLYRELGLETLNDRRWSRKLSFFI